MSIVELKAIQLPKAKDVLSFAKDLYLETSLGQEIALRIEMQEKYAQGMEELQARQATLEEQLHFLDSIFPPSLYRDKIINKLLTHAYTTWDDLELAESYLSSAFPESTERVKSPLGKEATKNIAFLTWLFHSAVDEQNVQPTDILNWLSVSGFTGTEEWKEELLALQNDETLQQALAQLDADELVDLISNFSLTNQGLMSDKFFAKYGEQLIHKLVESIQEEALDDRIAQSQQVLEKAAYTFLLNLPGEDRIEVLVLLAKAKQKYAGSEFVWEHVFVDVLYEFILGKKLLQMEKLLPPHMQDMASVAKESGRPASKFYVRDILVNQGRKDAYAGIGPLAGAASTATVYQLMDRDVDTPEQSCKHVIKVLNDGVMNDLEHEKTAFLEVIKVLIEEKMINIDIDVSEIFSQIIEMVEEELFILTESSNIRVMSRLRALRLDNGVAVPALVHRSPEHLEMEMAPGYSLLKIMKGENVPPEYKKIDLRKIAITVLSDYFEQVFTLGIYHTDEHAANIFVSIEDTGDPKITVIDHGQVGIADSWQEKRELMVLTLALDRLSINLLTELLYTRCKNKMQALLSEKTEDSEEDASKRQAQIKLLVAVSKRSIAQELAFDGPVPSLNFLVKKMEELSIRFGISMDLVNFAKGLLSMASLIDLMSMVDRSKIALPYIRKFGLEGLILKHSRQLSATTVRRILSGDTGMHLQ